MANILSTDDATFAGGQGNWTEVVGTTLSTASTPTSPGGNRVLKLTRATSGFLSVQAHILDGLYPTWQGRHHSLDLEINVPGTNLGTGELRAAAWVEIYKADGTLATPSGAGGTSELFDPGSGWHHVSVPDFPVLAAEAAWVGVLVQIFPDINIPPHGFAVGDVAYSSDVNLQGSPPEGVGGWAVGMVRMGAN